MPSLDVPVYVGIVSLVLATSRSPEGIGRTKNDSLTDQHHTCPTLRFAGHVGDLAIGVDMGA